MPDHEFAVWAPKPERVRLDVDGVLHPMTPSDGGWWRAVVDVHVDSRYGFVLDEDATVLLILAHHASQQECTSVRSCGTRRRWRGPIPVGAGVRSRAR